MIAEFDLTGRVALVTGGGTGIGRATALLLAARGADLAIAGRRPEPLAQTAEDIRALGRRALAVPGNVRRADEARGLVEAVVAGLGRLDILVNNAGGAAGHAGLAKVEPGKWERDIELNLSASHYCAQAAFPHLKASGGCVINVSSLAGMHGTKGVGAYSAAKAGVQMLTRVMAAEWGPSGVRANCVAPGMIATEAARRGWEKNGFDAAAAARKTFPLGRYGEMDDVAQAIAFLVSDAASYITGETLAVGGGPQLGGMVEVD